MEGTSSVQVEEQKESAGINTGKGELPSSQKLNVSVEREFIINSGFRMAAEWQPVPCKNGRHLENGDY